MSPKKNILETSDPHPLDLSGKSLDPDLLAPEHHDEVVQAHVAEEATAPPAQIEELDFAANAVHSVTPTQH